MAKKITTKKATKKTKVKTEPIDTGVTLNEENVDFVPEDIKKEEHIDTAEEIINEYNSLTDSIDKEIHSLNDINDISTVLEKKIEDLNNLDNKIEKRMNKIYEDAEKSDNKAVKRLVNRQNFGEFWSGISSGWFN